jgi:hypothetical protein
LSCGAAARTRLAAAPSWKVPIATLAVVGALSLGVLAAALVKLAAGSPPAAPATTRTLTTSPATVAPTRSTTAPGGLSGSDGATSTTLPRTGSATVPGRTSGLGTVGSEATRPRGTAARRSSFRRRLEERLRKRGLLQGAPAG